MTYSQIAAYGRRCGLSYYEAASELGRRSKRRRSKAKAVKGLTHEEIMRRRWDLRD